MGMDTTPQGDGGSTSTTSQTPSQPASGAGGQQGSQGTAPASSRVDLADDMLVRLPGANKDVKWGDHYRGLQAEFTRSKQAQAKLNQELTQLKQWKQQQEQAGRSRQAAEQPKPGAELVQRLKQLQYLNGEDAAALAEHLQGQFGAHSQELQKRDMALALIYKRLQAAEQALQGQVGRVTQTDFDAKISKWVRDAGYDEDATQFAKEMYLAYEPSQELDQEFPGMLKERLDNMERLARKRQVAQREQSRKLPFTPGQGGRGAAGGPLKDLARANSKQVANKLWELVDGGSERDT